MDAYASLTACDGPVPFRREIVQFLEMFGIRDQAVEIEFTLVTPLRIGRNSSIFGLGPSTKPPAAPVDPDLARVVTAWPNLPEPIRAPMLAMIASACPFTRRRENAGCYDWLVRNTSRPDQWLFRKNGATFIEFPPRRTDNNGENDVATQTAKSEVPNE